MTKTPFFDAWRAKAKRDLSPRGRKAELARFLTAGYGRDQRSWERHLSAILNGDRLPNAELFMAISVWRESEKVPPPKQRTARKT